MNKSNITTFALLLSIAFPTLGNAQTQKNYSGEAQLCGGVGSANPWSAAFKADFGGKLRVKPSFSINGINRNSSEENEDFNLTYTGHQAINPNTGEKGPVMSTSKDAKYASRRNTQSTGVSFNYGIEALYEINSQNDITASAKGNYLKLNTDGTLNEQNIIAPDYPFFDRYNVALTSTIDENSHKNNLEVAAGFRHWLNPGPGNSDGFAFNYSYSRESEDLKRKHYISPNSGDFKRFSMYDLHTHDVIQKHNVKAMWMTHVSMVNINLSAFHEYRLAESTDYQWFSDPINIGHLYDDFKHRYNTTGAFLHAWTKINNIEASARLEYDHTLMEYKLTPRDPWNEKHLNDFLPTLSAKWHINKSHSLSARYGIRLIRPTLELLNPAKINGTYTCEYGKESLVGMHVSNVAVEHSHNWAKATLNGTLQHIFSNDGFNALWMERNGIRNYTWGNEGKRRAFSLTERLQVKPADDTKVIAQGTVIWDKRIAEAIFMEKEHWGASAQLGVEQTLKSGTMFDVHGQYSEGNTVDLYSHEGRSYGAGISVRQPICKNLSATLAYDYREFPKLVITQGAYTGDIYKRNANRHALKLNLIYKL